MLFYGDNLRVLREHFVDASVDLVYLDPPFNSNQTYNVLFAEKTGDRSEAQIKAFDDTWHWDQVASHAYQEVVEAGGKVSQALQGFRTLLGTNDMMAYLANMAIRLLELRRVMKPTASIYLHCDPTASHYLKVLMDGIFGPKRFMNEITWKRSSAHSDTKQGMRRCGKIRDVILLYTKSEEYTWNPLYTPYTRDYLESEYRHVASPDGRRYKETDVTAARPGGDTEYEWRVKCGRSPGARWEADIDNEYKNPREGFDYLGVHPYDGRYWAYSKANMMEFARAGKLIHRKTGAPRLIQFSDEMPGIPLQDLWEDIPPETGSLDLGYPTQKPEALLDRIVNSSSNPGDIVLDPFCGCGTTISVAQRLKRCWIGIDITHLAVTLMKHRLFGAFGNAARYKVIGEPEDLAGATQLASEDPYQFQVWALGLVNARPAEFKKGADRGIDGRLYFHDAGTNGQTKQIVFSVKAGKLKPTYLRDLLGVVEREKADIGVFLSLEAPTRDMRTDAASSGFYDSPLGTRHPKVQLLTVEEIMNGKRIDYPGPSANVTFKQAPRVKDAIAKAVDMFTGQERPVVRARAVRRR